MTKSYECHSMFDIKNYLKHQMYFKTEDNQERFSSFINMESLAFHNLEPICTVPCTLFMITISILRVLVCSRLLSLGRVTTLLRRRSRSQIACRYGSPGRRIIRLDLFRVGVKPQKGAKSDNQDRSERETESHSTFQNAREKIYFLCFL